MNILLVDDEPGIRDGFAALLRLQGHVVHTADSVAGGLTRLDAGHYDLVVTDWRLGDGLGSEIVGGAEGPVIVMTGFPDDVEVETGRPITVVRKPVTAKALIAEVERLATPSPPAADLEVVLAALPCDTAATLRLAWALTGEATDAELVDDGEFVTLCTRVAAADDAALGRLELLGGDLRVLEDDDGLLVELRTYRDGRPEGAVLVEPNESWPDGPDDLAIDLARHPCDPERFADLVHEVERMRARGRTVHLLNTPLHLRLHMAILGEDGILPKRVLPGPRLPAVLAELWRSG